jgi:hypothetical protein
MKVPTIQRIPIRKSAFGKSDPNSNNSDQNANFFNEDPSIPRPKFGNSSELQTPKTNIHDERFTINDYYLSRQKGNEVGMRVDRRMIPYLADLHPTQDSAIPRYHIALNRETFRER